MQFFRTILFAADFSEYSRQAFCAACSLADQAKTKVVVLHVAEPTLIPSEPPSYGEVSVYYTPAEPDEADDAKLQQKLRDTYVAERPLDLEFRTCEGNAADEILRVANEVGSDVIVMGTHGRTGLIRLLAGSVTAAVLHGATCPVLALRSTERSRTCNELKVILHPTDFSANSDAALRVARCIAREHSARLIILNVEKADVLKDGTPGAEVDPNDCEKALENVRKRVEGPDLEYPVETLVRHGCADEEITRVAEERNCDLIVMGTHGRTGLGRLLMGSVAEYVLTKSVCPVLIVKYTHHDSARTSPKTADELPCVSGGP